MSHGPELAQEASKPRSLRPRRHPAWIDSWGGTATVLAKLHPDPSYRASVADKRAEVRFFERERLGDLADQRAPKRYRRAMRWLAVRGLLVFLACLILSGAAVAAEPPKPEAQPIPADTLKGWYVERLEIRTQRLELEAAIAQLQAREARHQAAVKTALEAAKVSETDWTFDLRGGTMARRSQEPAGATNPGGAATPHAAPKAPPVAGTPGAGKGKP